MMPRVFRWVGRVLVVVALAVLAIYNTGYVLVVVSPYRIQLSLNLLLVLGVFSVWLALSGWRGWRKVMTLSQSVTAYREQRSRRKGLQALAEAQRRLWMKDYADAWVAATEAYADADLAGMAAMLAWQAALGLQDDSLSAEWLAKAREFSEQEPAIAVILADRTVSRD